MRAKGVSRMEEARRARREGWTFGVKSKRFVIAVGLGKMGWVGLKGLESCFREIRGRN